MSKNNLHETQPDQDNLYHNEPYVDENFRPIQNIEGGGPMKKIDFNTMPRPLKVFGYFFFAIIILMGIAAIVISFLR
ncbi:hypothetical protein [Paenibacillus humicola]|uniref:hypothetical protein n=1 Tax=Paenibacillus humicola TaxID=3110540 RepID=UPI00237B124B|nr:hypothetical protein [Paenibacillus humicola]